MLCVLSGLRGHTRVCPRLTAKGAAIAENNILGVLSGLRG